MTLPGFLLFHEASVRELCSLRFFLRLPHDECRRRRLSRTDYVPPDVPGYFDVPRHFRLMSPIYPTDYRRGVTPTRGNFFEASVIRAVPESAPLQLKLSSLECRPRKSDGTGCREASKRPPLHSLGCSGDRLAGVRGAPGCGAEGTRHRFPRRHHAAGRDTRATPTGWFCWLADWNRGWMLGNKLQKNTGVSQSARRNHPRSHQ